MRVEAVLFVVSNVAVWSHSPLDDAHDGLLRRFRKPRYGWDVRLAIRAPGLRVWTKHKHLMWALPIVKKVKANRSY